MVVTREKWSNDTKKNNLQLFLTASQQKKEGCNCISCATQLRDRNSQKAGKIQMDLAGGLFAACIFLRVDICTK